MALVNCKECGKEVSTAADKCPTCGAPVSKRGIGFLAATVSILGFVVLLGVIGSMSNSIDKPASINEGHRSFSKTRNDRAGEILPADFEILSFTPRWEDGRLRAIGEIRNNGTIAGGPKVEVIARDASGTLIASQTFWPNSIDNIPPGGTCAIAYTITEDRRAKSADIKVIGVSRWDK